MKRSVKGLLAASAGVAVIATGATFALWSDSSTTDGGVITSGVLDVDYPGAVDWLDVSADRLDAGHSIVLDDFRISPGDTIQGDLGIDAALEGENVVATLSLSTDAAPSGALLAADDGVVVTYTLLDAAGDPVAAVTNVPFGTASTVTFAASDNGAAGALPTLPAALDSVNDYTVRVTATFDATTPDQVRQAAQADLQNLVVNLAQTRTAGAGGGF